MQHRKITMGIAAAGTIAASMAFVVSPASADYAPVAKDVVGIGSDTVQYASDFIADGDVSADPGWNSTGAKYKIINFDATPDANARLAYGNGGATGTCAPGTGGTAGTGSTNAGGALPCVLNPTIVARAGTYPVQRPNGSGGGAKAIAQDNNHWFSYSRASAAQGTTINAGSQGNFDSITIGTDELAMLVTNTTHAVPLSSAQLNLIYSCNAAARTWTQVGGTSPNNIIPVVPQVGSGTRKTFLADIGNPTLGSCVQTSEENDPTTLAAQTSPDDAISPMSGGRLNMFQGKDGLGNSVGAGYFKDPSCPLDAIKTNTPPACGTGNYTLAPAVHLLDTGSPSDSNPVYKDVRNLYIYFRHSDFLSATPRACPPTPRCRPSRLPP